MIRVLHGDCRAILPTLPADSVQCCVTSPPYYGLRDYGVAGQIGLEPTPDEYVAELVAVFREVRRVLRPDGLVFLNLGDSYHNLRTHMNGGAPTNTFHVGGSRDGTEGFARANRNKRLSGIKDKDMLGIPWMVAFALRADGWWLRKDIIWHKPNPMPESVTDRPTSSHEHVFMLARSERYFWDGDAVAEPAQQPVGDVATASGRFSAHKQAKIGQNQGKTSTLGANSGPSTRNIRDVWTIATQPYSGAHFATMPPELAERCIKAGSRPGDTILDPFGGAGTTGLVADRLGRSAVLIELNPEYGGLASERIIDDAPLFAEVAP